MLAASARRSAGIRWATTLTKVVLLTSAAAAIVLTTATAAPPVQSVARVDAERYAGTWYELARAPNSFQAECLGDVTATYRPLDDGSLKVINRCRAADEQWKVAVGRATALKGDASGARLRVSFLPGWLRWVPGTRADYWVVLLDDDYRYAVVSEPTREYLWILARTPTLDGSTFDAILARLRTQGYPVDSLVPTQQLPRVPPAASARRARLIV